MVGVLIHSSKVPSFEKSPFAPETIGCLGSEKRGFQDIFLEISQHMPPPKIILPTCTVSFSAKKTLDQSFLIFYRTSFGTPSFKSINSISFEAHHSLMIPHAMTPSGDLLLTALIPGKAGNIIWWVNQWLDFGWLVVKSILQNNFRMNGLPRKGRLCPPN